MKVTRRSHPNIFKAFDDIIADNVASSAIVKEIRKSLVNGYTIRGGKIDVISVEKFLCELSDEDRETLTMGDQDEAKEKFGKMKGFKDTDKLLGEFFENMGTE
jgi:hypothetical protein